MSGSVKSIMLALIALSATGCAGKMIANFGYTPTKVWYQTVEGTENAIVACDLRKDGAEVNCKSTGI